MRKSKNLWRGWKREQPSQKERTEMLSRCGRRCFLGKKTAFPICTKNTCKVNKKGLYAAYIRARQTKKNSIAKRAKRLISQY
jgi:hypothetical protein